MLQKTRSVAWELEPTQCRAQKTIHVVTHTLVLPSTVVCLDCFQNGNELKYIYIALKFAPFPKAAIM